MVFGRASAWVGEFGAADSPDADSGGRPDADLLGTALAWPGGAWTGAATVGASWRERPESGWLGGGEEPVSGSGDRLTLVSALVGDPDAATAGADDDEARFREASSDADSAAATSCMRRRPEAATRGTDSGARVSDRLGSILDGSPGD